MIDQNRLPESTLRTKLFHVLGICGRLQPSLLKSQQLIFARATMSLDRRSRLFKLQDS